MISAVAQSILSCFVVSVSGMKSLPAHMSNHCAAKRSSFFVVSIVYPSVKFLFMGEQFSAMLRAIVCDAYGYLSSN